MDGTRTLSIVVGVDDTPASQAALEFALNEGRVRGCAVEVISVWSWQGPHQLTAGPPTLPLTAAEARGRAQRRQNDVVAEVLAAVLDPPVVSRQVVQGDPADRLLRAARDADLLVVGSAHKGLLKRAVLGSVSETCLRHARCPVVVVPAKAEPVANATPTTNLADVG